MAETDQGAGGGPLDADALEALNREQLEEIATERGIADADSHSAFPTKADLAAEIVATPESDFAREAREKREQEEQAKATAAAEQADAEQRQAALASEQHEHESVDNGPPLAQVAAERAADDQEAPELIEPAQEGE